MCNFWSCVLTREGEVFWSKVTSSHEIIIQENNLKDNKLEDRDFVRLEVHPKTRLDLFSKNPENWEFKVDEKGTLPEWFIQEKVHWQELVFQEWKNAMKVSLWNLSLTPVIDFIESISKVKFFSMKGKIQASWHMSYGENWGAAWDAAGDAAGGAARGAAWDAARGAARGAAGDAAWDAARDADLLARCLLVKNKIAKKHLIHAKKRWAVWKAGYGLKCDVNGKLYVYAVKKPKPEKERKR
jgi:hypothetical protein